jgi:hypothetical protein
VIELDAGCEIAGRVELERLSSGRRGKQERNDGCR